MSPERPEEPAPPARWPVNWVIFESDGPRAAEDARALWNAGGRTSRTYSARGSTSQKFRDMLFRAPR
jgi:hypothetical protein